MKDKFKTTLWIASFIFLIALAIYLLIPSDFTYYEKIINHTYDIISLGVIILVFLTFRLFGLKSQEGKVWFFLFLGLAGWLIGDLIWTVFVYLELELFPSVADAFYIISYVLVFAALFSELKIVKSSVSKKSYAIATAVVLAILLIIGFSVLGPILLDPELDLVEKSVSLFYPFGDLVILFFAEVFILTFGKAKASKSWLFIGVGLFMWVIADTLYAYLEWHEIYTLVYHLVNLPFIAGLILIGLGAYYHQLMVKGET